MSHKLGGSLMHDDPAPGPDWTDHLKKVRLFEGLRDDVCALQVFSEAMKMREFAPGAEIIREGENGAELFILIEGTASIYKSTAEGEEYRVAILKGDEHPFFGEGGLLDAEARSATIRADTKARCLVLERAALDQVAWVHPQWALPVVQRIAKAVMERLRKTNNDLMLLYNALVNEIRGH